MEIRTKRTFLVILLICFVLLLSIARGHLVGSLIHEISSNAIKASASQPRSSPDPSRATSRVSEAAIVPDPSGIAGSY